jgi:hypothetical protein
MKKILIVLLFTSLLLLTGCTKDEATPLEKLVSEYETYSEIVDFTREGTLDLKLSVLTKGKQVTYLYYLEEIDRDREIVIFVEDEIVHEAFIVSDYLDDNTFYGMFTAVDLDITETTKAEFRLVSPGFHLNESVGVDIRQEFNIITSTDDLEDLGRVFIEVSDFEDGEVVLYTYEYTSKLIRTTGIVSSIALILVFALGLVIYKKKYKIIVNFKIQNPTSIKYRRWPDLILYRLLSGALVLVIWISVNIVLNNIYFNQYENKTGYNEDTLRYEEVISEEVNLRLGYTERYSRLSSNPDYVAFVHKESSHNIIGDLEVTLSGDEEMKAYVYPWGYGGYSYEVNYTYIQNMEFTVRVFDWKSDGNDVEYVEIFKRVFLEH